MKAKPFAQQQENGGLNLNREKSVARVAEYDQKEDVKADIDSHNQHQLQEKGQGFETKNAEHETDVKDLNNDFTNNNHAASDDIKPLDARPLQDVINERRISQGKKNNNHADADHHDVKPLAARLLQEGSNTRRSSHIKHPVDLFSDDLNHGPENCAACRRAVAPQRTIADRCSRRLLLAKQEMDRANSIPLNRRLPEPPKLIPIDPQEARENFYKNAPYMTGSD